MAFFTQNFFINGDENHYLDGKVIHKALATSIYKQISYYGIALEHYTGFKAELDCHCNRWSLKILFLCSILELGFAQASPPRASPGPQLTNSVSVPQWGFPAQTGDMVPQISGPSSLYSSLRPLHHQDAPKPFGQVSSLIQHCIHLSHSLKYTSVT